MHRDSDQQTWQVPDDEGLDRELYAILPNGVRRKRKMLVYWDKKGEGIKMCEFYLLDPG